MKRLGNDSKPYLPPLIVILGCTAIGKSTLALSIAQSLGGEVISADSRQVYRGLDIGTAKVSEGERAIVPHHLLDVVDPGEDFSVAEYQKLAFKAINDIVNKGRVPILVGGTGLYIWAVIDNLLIPPCPPDPALRQSLAQLSTEVLVSHLHELDPVSAGTEYIAQNKRRLIRALEVSIKTGHPFSSQKGKGVQIYDTLQIGLKMPREDLIKRIDDRVDLRFKSGMVEEVESLLQNGVSYQWLDSLGLEYRYVSRHIQGEIEYGAMVKKLKTEIHRYAKRQRSWFKRDKRIVWFDTPPNEIDIFETIHGFLKTNGLKIRQRKPDRPQY